MSGCGTSRQSVGVLRDLRSESRLCLCDFELREEHQLRTYSGTTNLLGAMSDAAANNAKTDAEQYYTILRVDMTRIFEDSLRLSNGFQYVPAGKLIAVKNDKSMPIDTIVKDNNLFACISARAGLGFASLLKRNLAIVTEWNIIGLSGRTMEIETEVRSKDTYGLMTNLQDPDLRPVWLDLARESASQLNTKLAQLIREARNVPNENKK